LRSVGDAALDGVPAIASGGASRWTSSGREERDPAQVQAAVAEHVEQQGVARRGPGDHDAQRGLGLRQVQPLDAVGEHRGARLAEIEPALVHRGDVGHEVGLDAARVAQDRDEPRQQLIVGERPERVGFHVAMLRRRPAA
jgi:hypothetical protein